MSKRKVRIYLLILASAVAVWIPLYPILYSLSPDTSGLALQFLRTKPKYVYFGDSVLTTTECESDARSVIDLLPNGIAEKTIAFNRGGYDAEIWRHMTRFIAARGSGFVSAVIIPINMGAFSATWARPPSREERIFFPLASGNVSMGEYLGMLAEVHFPEFDDPDMDGSALQQKLVWAGSKPIGTLKNVTAELKVLPVLGCNEDSSRFSRLIGLRFALNYGAPIGPQDPILPYTDEMVVALRRAGIKPVVISRRSISTIFAALAGRTF